MKIITKNETNNNSLNVAKTFSKDTIITFSNEFDINSTELVLYVPDMESTLFSAEFVSDLFGSFDYFKQMYENIIITPSNHIEYYQYPEPTIIHFAGSRLWRTSSRIPDNSILFGIEADLALIFNSKEKLLYNNGIFYGGKYTVISPLPSIIVDLSKEQLPTVNSAMFNIESYKHMIDQIPTNEGEQNEVLPSNN